MSVSILSMTQSRDPASAEPELGQGGDGWHWSGFFADVSATVNAGGCRRWHGRLQLRLSTTSAEYALDGGAPFASLRREMRVGRVSLSFRP